MRFDGTHSNIDCSYGGPKDQDMGTSGTSHSMAVGASLTSLGAALTIRPRIDHVPHILHSLKDSFKTSALKTITEAEASNKHIWS